MIYFIDDELFQEYQRESAWLCFPAQDQEDTRNRGGLEGTVSLSNGAEQLVVCYPSLPPENGHRDDDREKLEFKEFMSKNKITNVEDSETTLETEVKTEEAALENPEAVQEQLVQTQEEQESVLVGSEVEQMEQTQVEQSVPVHSLQEDQESIQVDSAYGGMDQQMMRGTPERKEEKQKTAPEEGHHVPGNGPYPSHQPYHQSAPQAEQGQQYVNPMYTGANPNQPLDQRGQNTMPVNPSMCQRCGGHRGHVPVYYYPYMGTHV